MLNDNYAKTALEYAQAVVKKKIPNGQSAIQACRRHINDLKKQRTKAFPYRFSEVKAANVCQFLEGLPHIKASWAGQLIKLEPWQIFVASCLFGWVRKSDGYRRFREGYLEVARKNAKSTFAAEIGLYMLTEDGEPGAEVYCGATNEKQAWEVFTPARLMAKKAEDFTEHYQLHVAAQSIYQIDSASKFLPIVGNPGDGSSPHCAIVDEFHEHPTPVQYDAMITGMGARTQPLCLVTTTAGVNIAGPCYEKRDQVLKVLDGTFDNPELFGIIYTTDEDDDWTDFKVWQKANPNLGVSVFEDFLRARLLEAKQRPERQNIIRCKHLNQWMNASVAWLDMLKWRRCADTTLALEDFRGKKCVMALDLASKIDLTAKVYLFEENGLYTFFGKYYVPEDTAELPQNGHYRSWISQGWLKATMGNVLDFELFRDDILKDTANFEIEHIAFDPWNAAQMAQELQKEGASVFEYRNTVQNMSEPMKLLQALVYSQKLQHNGDPVMAWMMSNVVAKVDAKDNIFPRKELEQNKIDGPVAAIMATGLYVNQQENYLTGYEQGIEFY